jgi:integrase
LKATLWDKERLGIKPARSWREAVLRWIGETSGKTTHKEDLAKLRWLDPYLGNLELNDIDRDVIDVIRLAKLKEASKATTNRYLALVRAILMKSRDDWEWLDKVPKIKLFKETADRERSLTPEQAQNLLRELPSHQREYVMFALATGLRQSNVLKLEWGNVDIERRHAWVSAINSKNRKPIAVPLNDISMAVLLRQKGKHSTRVFTYAGKPIVNANTRAWRSALVRAGITNFRWHDLRHTWATWQRQSGTPTYELQKLGGWKSATMVERYAHLAPDNLSVAAERINGLIFGYDLATANGK